MRKKLDNFYSNPGSPQREVYTAVKFQNGQYELVVDYVEDWQEYINSHEESVSLEHILALCATGDTSALNRVQGVYIDTVDMPKSLRDVLDIVSTGHSQFDGLPIEVRNKFGNDFVAWFTEAGTDEWREKMGMSKESEVKDNAES